MLNNKLSKFVFLALTVAVLNAGAVDGLRGEFQFSGLLTDSNNNDAPITNASIVLKVGIYNPLADCLLYEETHTVDTSATGGRFSVLVGSGSSTGAGANLTLRNSLLANLTVSSGTSGCSSGYTSSPSDIRKMKVNMHPSGHSAEDLSPHFTIAASPTALVAESLSDGLTSDKIIKVNSSQLLTQANAENIFSQYSALNALLSGSSSLYAKNNASTGTSIVSSSTTPAGVAAGSIWYDSTSNQLKYYNGSTEQTLSTTAGGGGTVTSVSGTAPITITNGTTTPNISISSATTSVSGVVTLATNGGTTAGTVIEATDSRLNDARTPMGTTLTNGQTWIGNGSNVASARTLNMSDIKSTGGGNWLTASGSCAAGNHLDYNSVTDSLSCQSFALTSPQITAALGYTPANSSNSVSKSGDTMTGVLNLPAGGITVGSSQFVVLANGKVGIGDPSPETNLKVTSGDTSTIVRVANSLSTSARYPGFDVVNYAGGVGGNPTISLKNFNGSGGTPTAATTGMTLGEISAYGGDGSANAVKSSLIRFLAEENFSASAAGGGLRFLTTAPGTIMPTERITILGSGNVGIGTNSPTVKLDVNGDIWATSLKATTGIYGNAVPLRLGVSAAEHMRIDTTGNVGVGVTSPSDKLHVYGTSPNLLKLESSAVAADILLSHSGGSSKIKSENTSGPTIQFDAGNDTTPELTIKSSNGNVGIATSSPAYKLDVNGDINSSGSVRASGVALTSDIRYKKDIEPLENALEKILSIRGVSYNWRQEEFGDRNFNNRHQIGVIAQEVEKQFPELVDTNKNGYKSVNYPAMVAPIIESIRSIYDRLVSAEFVQAHQAQELASKVDKTELQNELREKDQQIKELEARLERLEKRLESK